MKNSAFRKLFPEWTEAHDMRAKAEEAEEQLLEERRRGSIGAGPESLGGDKAEGKASVLAEGESMAGREKVGSRGPPPPPQDSSPLLTVAVIVAVVFAIAAAVSGAARWR